MKNGSPLINFDFIDGFKECLKNRKRSVWIPREFQEERTGTTLKEYEVSTSTMRRTIRVGKKIARKVSSGIFPGDYR